MPPVRGTVLHATGGGSAESSIRWFEDPAARVSAHFTIARAGDVTQSVGLDRAAWHAGPAEMPIDGETTAEVNGRTIGIELANHQRLERRGAEGFVWRVGDSWREYEQESRPVYAGLQFDAGTIAPGWWEPFRREQIDALVELLAELRGAGYAVDPIAGHCDVAQPLGRKLDPGPLFPWARVWRGYCRTSQVDLPVPAGSDR